MDKPISVVMSELDKKVEEAINEAKLHPMILETMFETYLSRIRATAQEWKIREALAWEESKKEEEE